jgi:hypothetical protein
MDDEISDEPTVGELLEVIEQLREENEQLRERVQELEWKLDRDSSNSHRPPSSDPPWESSDSSDSESQPDRKKETNSGTEGARRELVDEQQVDEFIEVKPDECKHCGEALAGDDLEPWRHQRWDVEISRTVREYRMHRLTCSCCGESTRATLPEGVDRSPFGSKVVGWVGMLTGLMDVTKRKVQRIVEQGFKIPMGLGSVCRCEKRVSQALVEPIGQLQEAIRSAPAVWVDETSWSEGADDCWLWVAVNDSMALYRIQNRRTREALETLIPAEYGGIVTSDRYGVYNGRSPEDRQHCWAHLFRDLEGVRERDGPGAEWAMQLQTIMGIVLEQWHAFKRGEITRERLQKKVEQRWRPIVISLLAAAADQDNLPGIFGRLNKREPALWQFVIHEGLEPTNNTAERAVRSAVVKRKISYGTESSTGSRFIERILSVGETLRRQGREAIDYLTEAVERYMANRPAPSLLPS